MLYILKTHMNTRYANNKTQKIRVSTMNSIHIIDVNEFNNNYIKKDKSTMFNKNNDIYINKYKRYIEYIKSKKGISNLNFFIFISKIIQYIILFDSICIMAQKNKYMKNSLSNSYEVTLKVKGTGIQTVLNSGFTCPSEAYLNGIKVTQCHCNHVDIDVEGKEIKLVWNQIITTAYQMFRDCNTITEIDLTRFDTSSVTNMYAMFDGCQLLTSLDVSNLITNKVKQMDVMFYNCYLLSSINLGSFDTSLVTSLGYMFYQCKSLTSINLSHFKTGLVYDIDYMFYNNYELTSIDLSNFNTQSMTQMDHIFYGCTKLEYINLKNFEEKLSPTTGDMFTNIVKNAVICLDSNKSQNVYQKASLISCVTFSCNNDWRSVQKKIVKDTGLCVDSCSPPLYKYEGECYSSCPANTVTYNYNCYLCSQDCKTCNYNINILKTECTSCYENKYLHKGNCVDECINGYYEDENDSSIKICKCEEYTKCKSCSKESLSHNNLCISCNDYYYPILNDNNNFGNYINCYNGNLDYYYLDDDNYYKSCYYSCKTCNINGNNKTHNCITCNTGYELNISKNNFYNCYPKCNNYYYFDNEGNYICLKNSECPIDFNKLIPERGECLDNCTKDSHYQYEFRNTCYNECPSDISYISKSNNYFCEVNCTKQMPFEIVNEQNCINFCSINDIDNKLCKSKYEDEDTNSNLILNNIHKDIITSNFNKNELYIMIKV